MAPEFTLPPGMCRDEFDAMGTRATVLLPSSLSGAGFPLVRSLFDQWERTLSRFLPESELSYVNARAGQPVMVSPLFLHVLLTALQAARSTGGIYDPTLLHQLVGAGYDRSFVDLPADRPPSSYRASPGGGWRSVAVDRRSQTVTLPAGVALDFGGIAKGMAVDAALEQLITLAPEQAAVEAGGDLRVHGHPPGGESWPIAIEGKDDYETVALYQGALATSSVSRRRWKQGEVPRHHLLDPRSGEPVAHELWSVSVVAPRCAQADVAAKTAFVLGPGEGEAFLARHNLPGLMIMQGGERWRVGPWIEWPVESRT